MLAICSFQIKKFKGKRKLNKQVILILAVIMCMIMSPYYLP